MSPLKVRLRTGAAMTVAAALASLLAGCERPAAAAEGAADGGARPGPYGPGTGATPPAAQGRGRDGGSSRSDASTTTSGAGMADGGAYVPGTGVARERDDQEGGATGRREGDEIAPKGRDR
jgi:hypothetical protein